MCGLSLVVVSRGYSLLQCAGFSLQWLQSLWLVGSVVAARGLYSTGSVVVAHGLVAPRHVGSSRTRAQTRVPCIGGRILNHCATREAPIFLLSVLKTSPQPLSLDISLLNFIYTHSSDNKPDIKTTGPEMKSLQFPFSHY